MGTDVAMRHLVLIALAASLALPAHGLVVAGSPQERYTRIPALDPGWAHVGSLSGPSAIYLGNGWVLTAWHVGIGEVDFGGVTYPPVEGSRVQLESFGRPAEKADLALFRIDPAPDLPVLRLRERSPSVGTRLILIGHGRGRGEPLTWRGHLGYRWSAEHRKRWGTNSVQSLPFDIGRANTLTRCFIVAFDRSGTRHEAQAAVGDSGGAAFARGRDGWELAGVLFSIGFYPSQVAATALFGNVTSVADVSYYREQILRRVAPRPSKPGEGARD